MAGAWCPKAYVGDSDEPRRMGNQPVVCRAYLDILHDVSAPIRCRYGDWLIEGCRVLDDAGLPTVRCDGVLCSTNQKAAHCRTAAKRGPVATLARRLFNVGLAVRIRHRSRARVCFPRLRALPCPRTSRPQARFADQITDMAESGNLDMRSH